MKLQLGMLHTNGRPATPVDLATLLGEFASRPAETSGEIIAGSLVMAYRGDRITHEEDGEVQPLRCGPYILTWDGRLDNREHFSVCFPATDLQTIPDPVIVLRAYQMFGESVFAKLVGEFALSLWCKRTKSLLLARSTCGARPLFYTTTNNTLFWSSDFGHLVRISNVDLEVNETYFLEYLLTQPSTKHTPLTKISAVGANSVLHFQDGRLKQSDQLWNATHIETLRYRTDQEYEEHYRIALTEAVRVRLRAKGPVFAELSGGLDSSSIVLTADQVLKANNQALDGLLTISAVYEESQTCDEHKFIRLVEERRGRPTLLVGEKEQGFTLGLGNPEFTGLPNPNHCSPGRYERFAALVKEGAGHVLLTGHGGDHLFWSAPEGAPLVADELRRVNFLGAHRECRVWSRAALVPYLQLLIKRAVPLATGQPYDLLEPPDWLSHKMKEQVTENKAALLGDQPNHVRPSRRAQLFAVDLLFRSVACGYFNEYKDLYVSHPYTHRPLVEFCLAMPLSQFLREGKTRSLMRRALVDVLPTKICRRTSKAGADEAYLRAMQREWASHSDVRRWNVSERGFVDPGRLSGSLDATRLGIRHQNGHLMRLVSMERWLRSLQRITAPNKAQPNERAYDFPQLLNAV
jgi:asparagine synthase (glutamine-hydrolysing)